MGCLLRLSYAIWLDSVLEQDKKQYIRVASIAMGTLLQIFYSFSTKRHGHVHSTIQIYDFSFAFRTKEMEHDESSMLFSN